MASTDRYYTDSSSYTYNARTELSSSSAARPHHRLPGHYQTSSSSSYQHRPADQRDYHSTSSSSSPHVRLPAGYQDRYGSSSTSYQSSTSDYRRYAGTASSSSTQTYHNPRPGGSSAASTTSSSAIRGLITPGEARSGVLDLQHRLQRLQNVKNSSGGTYWLQVAYRTLYEEARVLRKGVSRGKMSTTMSMFGGETGMDPLEEEIDVMLKTIEKELWD